MTFESRCATAREEVEGKSYRCVERTHGEDVLKDGKKVRDIG